MTNSPALDLKAALSRNARSEPHKRRATMNVAVIGPGALGILYATRMASNGSTATLVDHDAARAKRLTLSGLTVERASDKERVRVPVTAAIPSDADFILICVKAHSTKNLQLPRNVPVLSVQNGLNNVETIAGMVGSGNILAGITTEAVTLVDEGHIRHVADGITTFGAWTDCDSAPAESALAAAGFECAITDAPGQTIWEKAAVSAGINPLTALLNVPNGQLLDVRETRELLRDLVVEAAKVASIEGYRFSRSLVEVAEDTCKKTAENISSMLQDVRAGRKTEIDAISGEILRRAERAALPAPRTRVVYQLVRGIESH